MASTLEHTFFWVSDDSRRFAGSSCPGLNSAMAVDVAFLKEEARAINSIISLNDSTALDWLQLSNAGIRHMHVPVPDHYAPSIDQLSAIVRFLESGPTAPSERVLVHCNAGRGRTCTVLAALLVWERNLEPDAAIEEVRLARRGSGPGLTNRQIDAVRQWRRFLSSAASTASKA